MQLDLEFIRQNFPAFDVPSLQGQSFLKMLVALTPVCKFRTVWPGSIGSAKYSLMRRIRHRAWAGRKWTRRVRAWPLCWVWRVMS